MASYARERQVAETAVWTASIVTKRVQSTVSGISKHDNSPVTVADFAAQALLIKALHDAFPDDTFVGEEGSAALRADEALRHKVYELVSSAADTQGAALPKPASVEEMLDLIDLGGSGTGSDKGRFWVMDPIDGTATFLKGQQYAVALALIEDGKEVVGVLGCPNISPGTTRIVEDEVDKTGQGILLSAVRGQGSIVQTMTLKGLESPMSLPPIEPTSPEKLHFIDCDVDPGCNHAVVAKLASQFGAVFPNTEIWSAHVRYAALALGCGDVQILVPANPASKIWIWDHAGGMLLFTEVGGKITDLDGKEIDLCAGRALSRNRGVVMANGAVHETVLKGMQGILG